MRAGIEGEGVNRKQRRKWKWAFISTESGTLQQSIITFTIVGSKIDSSLRDFPALYGMETRMGSSAEHRLMSLADSEGVP